MVIEKYKSKYINVILMIIFSVNIYFLCTPFFDFLIGRWKPVAIGMQTAFYGDTLLIFNSIMCLIIIIISPKFKFDDVFISYLFLFFLYFFSIIVNGIIKSKFSFITTPLSYFVFFCLLRQYKVNKNIISIIYIVLLLYTILPIVLLPILPSYITKYFYSIYYGDIIATFKGFAIHKNVYGFYAGMVAIMTLLLNIKNILKYSIYIVLLFGIILSESRTALLGTMVISFIYFMNNSKALRKYGIIITLTLMVVLIYYYYVKYSFRGIEYLISNSDRITIIKAYIKIFSHNLLFGVGYHFSTKEGVMAHNFIFQTLVSYGILVTISFCIFLYNVWKNISYYARIMFLYLLITGMFQPYFSLVAINNMCLINVILMIAFNYQENEIIGILPNIRQRKYFYDNKQVI